MGKVVALILQARMGSTRLPGKSMLDLAGAPVVGRILERVKRCKIPDHVILAIPDTPTDRILARLAREHGVTPFLGSENDVSDRYYQAALSCAADLVVRIPADNPVPEPSEIDRIIKHHMSLSRRGFSSNLSEINGSGYPDGIGAEVFDLSLLAESNQSHSNRPKREHVHLNFFDYQTQEAVDEVWCPISTVQCPPEFRRPDLVLDINTPGQYEFFRALYEDLYPNNPEFHITDIISWYDNTYVPSLGV